MSNGKSKGNAFERLICKELSLWWTDKTRDDIFWRTDSSGGRATQRAKTGKTTFGQYGDIQATDPIGQPLMDLFCIELKIGYGGWDLLEYIDSKQTTTFLQKCIAQVTADCEKAEIKKYPVLIFKRDRRQPCILLSVEGFYLAQEKGLIIPAEERITQGITLSIDGINYFVFNLNNFFECFNSSFTLF